MRPLPSTGTVRPIKLEKLPGQRSAFAGRVRNRNFTSCEVSPTQIVIAGRFPASANARAALRLPLFQSVDRPPGKATKSHGAWRFACVDHSDPVANREAVALGTGFSGQVLNVPCTLGGISQSALISHGAPRFQQECPHMRGHSH